MSELIDQTPEAKPPHKPLPLGKTMLINFGIMLLYMLFTITMSSGGSEDALGMMAADATLLVFQVGINLFVGLILLFTDLKQVGGAMMISGLAIALLGFGACIGKAGIMDSI